MTSTRRNDNTFLSLAVYMRHVLLPTDKLSLWILIATSGYVAYYLGDSTGYGAIQTVFLGLVVGTAAALLVVLFAWKRTTLRWARIQATQNRGASGPYARQVP